MSGALRLHRRVIVRSGMQSSEVHFTAKEARWQPDNVQGLIGSYSPIDSGADTRVTNATVIQARSPLLR